jgi:hypothetical protein
MLSQSGDQIHNKRIPTLSNKFRQRLIYFQSVAIRLDHLRKNAQL